MQIVLSVVLLIGAASSAFAQAAIIGEVVDESGAPLAHVVVEAASPSLIEKARTATTDDSGRYRISDLRPGTYDVTFMIVGKSPYMQDDVELSGAATAVVNAALVTGTFADGITVTREQPIVDVVGTTRELSLGGELVRLLPTTRSYNGLLVLVPGVTTSINDVITGAATMSFPVHGGRTNESRLLLDGFNVGSPPAGNSGTTFVVDVGNAVEVTFSSADARGDVETSGVLMNVVPRSGGNATSGAFYASGTSRRLQSNNATDTLRAQGVVEASPLTRVYDLSGSIGGPIARDRLWYFANAHTGGSTRRSSNVFYNLHAGDASKWRYAPDRDQLEYSDRTFDNASGRLTWQIGERHTLTGLWDVQSLCRACTGATPGLSEPQRISPEAVGVLGRRLDVTQMVWTSPLSDRILVEAGYGGTYFGVGNFEREPNPTRDLVRIVEQCANGCAVNGGIPGLVYRSQDFSVAHVGSYLWKGSAAVVTGSHAFRAGVQHTFMTDDRTWYTNTANLTYRVNNGVPNQLTQSISPWVNNSRVAWTGMFAQDQWTHDRLSVQGAIRFDRARSWFPAQTEGPSRFLPVPVVVSETRGIDSYKDVTIRSGAAYDLFGNSRTALKVSLGKYLEGAGVSGNYAATNPTLRMPQTTPAFGTAGVTRAWTDADGDFVPDCDLLNPSAQDLRGSGGDLCGVISNTRFGQNVLTNDFDPELLSGWGVRPSDWNVSLSLQQQIGARASIDLTYRHRSYAGFTVIDNQALEPADLTPFSVTAPVDARLPGGGGHVLSGLYDIVPEKAGQVRNLFVDASRFGDWEQRFNGLDVTFQARAAGGLSLMTGMSIGQTVADTCSVRANLPELSTTMTGTSPFGPGLSNSAVTPVSPYCHVAFGVLTQLRGFAAYTVPRLSLQLSATFQTKPGPMLAANYAVPNADVVSSLGRSLSGNAANVTVNLVEPGTLYGNRINQVDLRVARPLRSGRLRALLALDAFNALNSSAVLAYNHAFVPGGTWLQPMTIMTPRFIKLTVEIGM